QPRRDADDGGGDRSALPLARQSGAAALGSALPARRERVSVSERRASPLAMASGASLYAEGRRDRVPRRLRGGGVVDGRFRRQLQLAGPDLVSGQLSDHRVAAEVSLLPG